MQLVVIERQLIRWRIRGAEAAAAVVVIVAAAIVVAVVEVMVATVAEVDAEVAISSPEGEGTVASVEIAAAAVVVMEVIVEEEAVGLTEVGEVVVLEAAAAVSVLHHSMGKDSSMGMFNIMSLSTQVH